MLYSPRMKKYLRNGKISIAALVFNIFSTLKYALSLESSFKAKMMMMPAAPHCRPY